MTTGPTTFSWFQASPDEEHEHPISTANKIMSPVWLRSMYKNPVQWGRLPHLFNLIDADKNALFELEEEVCNFGK